MFLQKAHPFYVDSTRSLGRRDQFLRVCPLDGFRYSRSWAHACLFRRILRRLLWWARTVHTLECL